MSRRGIGEAALEACKSDLGDPCQRKNAAGTGQKGLFENCAMFCVRTHPIFVRMGECPKHPQKKLQECFRESRNAPTDTPSLLGQGQRSNQPTGIISGVPKSEATASKSIPRGSCSCQPGLNHDGLVPCCGRLVRNSAAFPYLMKWHFLEAERGPRRAPVLKRIG